MKILFLVERNLYYKFYGPIIEGFISRGHEIHLLHRYKPENLDLKNQKLFYYPFLSQVPQFSKKICFISMFSKNEEINDYANCNGINFIFSLGSRGGYSLPKIEAKWCTIQHGLDSFVEKNFNSDYFFVYSKNWIQSNSFTPNKDVIIIETGMYYCEEYIKDEVMKKYNLDQNKKYVFFIPLPVNTSSSYTFIRGRIRRFFINRYLIKTELKLLKFLNEKFNKIGYEIIIKTRFKRFLSKNYYKYAKVFYDECFYPSTVNELLSISEVTVVNFMPGAIATEASFYKKKFVFIHYSQYDREVFPHVYKDLNEIYFPEPREQFYVDYTDKDKIIARIVSGENIDTSDYRMKYVQPHNKNGVNVILDLLKA